MKPISPFAAAILIGLSLAGCSKAPQPDAAPGQPAARTSAPPAAPGGKTAELWRYLNGFTERDTVPSVAGIEEKFGKPDEPVSETAVMTMPAKSTMARQERLKDAPPGFGDPEYHRFTAEEVAAEADVGLVQHIYNHDAKPWTRYIEIRVRAADRTVAGWGWVENVPPGQEIGAPK